MNKPFCHYLHLSVFMLFLLLWHTLSLSKLLLVLRRWFYYEVHINISGKFLLSLLFLYFVCFFLFTLWAIIQFTCSLWWIVKWYLTLPISAQIHANVFTMEPNQTRKNAAWDELAHSLTHSGKQQTWSARPKTKLIYIFVTVYIALSALSPSHSYCRTIVPRE